MNYTAQSPKLKHSLSTTEESGFSNDAEILFDWLSDKSKHTQRSYWGTWVQFQEFLGAKVEGKELISTVPIGIIKKQQVRLFLEHCLRSKGNSPSSLNQKLAALSSLFNHAIGESYTTVNPTLNIKLIKDEKLGNSKKDVKQKIISREDVKKLIENANCYRDGVLFELLYVTGMRIHEALNLRWKDIYKVEGIYYVSIIGKGHKHRENKLPTPLIEKLRKLKTREYIFLSNQKKKLSTAMADKAIKQAKKKAEISEDVSCHTLRHSHASHALANGANLTSVRDQLGHSSIEITSKYLHTKECSSDFIFL